MLAYMLINNAYRVYIEKEASSLLKLGRQRATKTVNVDYMNWEGEELSIILRNGMFNY